MGANEADAGAASTAAEAEAKEDDAVVNLFLGCVSATGLGSSFLPATDQACELMGHPGGGATECVGGALALRFDTTSAAASHSSHGGAGNARIYNVGKSQSCMVSKLPILWKQAVAVTVATAAVGK